MNTISDSERIEPASPRIMSPRTKARMAGKRSETPRSEVNEREEPIMRLSVLSPRVGDKLNASLQERNDL